MQYTFASSGIKYPAERMLEFVHLFSGLLMEKIVEEAREPTRRTDSSLRSVVGKMETLTSATC